jgi:hypothetical protein
MLSVHAGILISHNLGGRLTGAGLDAAPMARAGSRWQRFLLLRNIHAVFEAFLPGKTHGYCVKHFKFFMLQRTRVSALKHVLRRAYRL